MAQDERAAPITLVLAERVRHLRKAAGLSHSDLAERVSQLGPAWSRSTAAKLENRRRESVTLQECLALARVLDVPLPWLLIDPMAVSAVPIAGVEVAPWRALMWLTGRVPLADPPGAAWGTAAPVIALAHQIAAVSERWAQLRAHREIVAQLLPGDGDKDRADDDERHERRLLADLARPLAALQKLDYPRPPLPCDLIERAAALGVELDGEG